MAEKRNKKKRKMNKFWIILAAVVVLVVVGNFYFIGGNELYKEMPPAIISISHAPRELKLNQNVTLCAKVRDNSMIKEIEFDLSDGRNRNFMVDAPSVDNFCTEFMLTSSKFSWSLKATDDAGQYSLRRSGEISVTNNPPQILGMWINPEQAKKNETVKLCANATDDEEINMINISIPSLKHSSAMDITGLSQITVCDILRFNNSVEFFWLAEVTDISGQKNQKTATGVIE